MMSPFASFLAKDITAFLSFKRALEHPYRQGEFTLHSFDRYLQHHAPNGTSRSLQPLLLEWLSERKNRKSVTIANELGVIRQLCLFMRRRDSAGFVPGREWASQSSESHFLPYILSRQEVRELLRLTQTVRRPRFRSTVLRNLLLILYCTGLRFGEAVRLELRDVDLRQRLFVVRESKGRTRLVPFRSDLERELRRYLAEREQVAGRTAGEALFVQPNGRPYHVDSMSKNIRRLLRRAGLKPDRGRTGPRPYDFRHAFAVHRLTQWYRAGIDIHRRLPWLSAYMGHKDILGTEVYLTATPELLAIAARRFEQRFRSKGKYA